MTHRAKPSSYLADIGVGDIVADFSIRPFKTLDSFEDWPD